MGKKTRKTNIIVYFAVVAFALLFLYVGNKIATQNMAVDFDNDNNEMARAKVIRILDRTEEVSEWWSQTTITFEAQVTEGAYKNEIVTATQSMSDYFAVNESEVTEGAKVLLQLASVYIDEPEEWHFSGYVMIDKILILCAVFAVLLLIFGRVKGLNAILSLGFTCAAIFAVFVPSILSGKDIYGSSIIICVYTIIVTLFILNGVNRKSLAAVGGCFGGVIAAGLITLLMNSALGLTGWIDSESIHLVNLPTETPIDLKAIIFAGIIIGAVGAIMDVAVSISSAMSELKEQAPNLPFHKLFKSGINIGKDIMGSMTNTLVLAYIGSSLTIILLLAVYASSFVDLLNREMVIVEILQALVGSLGILLTMPLTALICAFLYSRKPLQGEIEGFS